jgi:hypothetical protein
MGGVAALLMAAQALAEEPAASRFQGATLTSVTYARADMLAMSASRVVQGSFAELMTAGDGDTIVKTFNIADPALAISARLTPLVAAHYQTSNTAYLADRDSEDDSVSDLTRAAAGRGIVIDVETRSWELRYFPFDWRHYQVNYSARARLIDATTGRQIARETCDYSSGDDEPSPTYDELVRDNAMLLKAKLDAAAASCVGTLAKTLLGP